MMNLSLNNQPVQVENGLQLSALLEQQPPQGAFAVAVNGEFVPRSCYGDTRLAEGDEVDIVNPVGGG